jgi:hypothetical protein
VTIHPSPTTKQAVGIEGPDIVVHTWSIDPSRPRIAINKDTMCYEFNSKLINTHRESAKQYAQRIC